MASLRDLFKLTLQYGGLQLVGRLIRLALVPLFTYLLAPDDYGLLDLAGVTSTILMVAMLGVDYGMGFLYYDDKDPAHHQRVFSTAFWSVLVLTSAAAAGLFFFGGRAFASGDVFVPPRALILICAAVPVTSEITLVAKFLRVRLDVRRFGVLALSNMLVSVGGAVTSIAIFRWGVMGLFAMNLCTESASLLLGIFLARGYLVPRWSAQLARSMLALGLPIVPHIACLHALQAADRYVLAGLHGREAVGYYGVAAKLGVILTAAMGAMQAAWGPWAYSISRDDNAASRYARALRLLTVTWTSGCVALCFFGREILTVATAPEYAPAILAVAPIALAAYFQGLYSAFQVTLHVAKRTAPLAGLGLLALAVNLACLWAWAPRWGFVGVAWSQAAAFAAALAGVYLVGRRVYPLPYRGAHLAVCAGVAAAAGGVVAVLGEGRGLSPAAVALKSVALALSLAILWKAGAGEVARGLLGAVARARKRSAPQEDGSSK